MYIGLAFDEKGIEVLTDDISYYDCLERTAELGGSRSQFILNWAAPNKVIEGKRLYDWLRANKLDPQAAKKLIQELIESICKTAEDTRKELDA
jgi:hypothetical protein